MLTGYLTALYGLVVAALIFLSAGVLGNSVLQYSPSNKSRIDGLFGLALGISIIGTLLSALSVARLISPVLVLSATFAPLAIWPGRAWGMLKGIFKALPDLVIAPRGIIFLRVVALLYIGYVAVHTIFTWLGADLTIYHLVVPRDVLRNGGYIHNDFFFASGIPFGWHHFGLAGYLLAGTKGYLALALCAFLATLTVTFLSVTRFFPGSRESGVADCAVIIVCLVTVGMLQGSVSGTDVPALFFNSILIMYLFGRMDEDVTKRAFALGMVSGFSIAIKLTTAPISLIVLGLLLLGSKRRRSHTILAFGGGVILCASIWPAVKLWATGSPLPVFMPSLYFWGHPSEQLLRALNTIWSMYDDWYEINFARFFTHNMAALPFFIVFAIFGLMIPDAPTRRKIQAIMAVAVANTLGIVLFSRRWDIVFHDRYHLFSYCLVAVAGLLALHWCIRAGQERLGTGSQTSGLIPYVVVALVLTNLFGLNILRDRRSDGSITVTELAPISWQFKRGLVNFKKELNDYHDPVSRFVAEKTPRDSVVATTTVSVYMLDRRFLQLLPIAQNVIDLSKPPDRILAELRARGVNYLHLPAFTSLNPWANEAMEPYIVNLRLIAKLPSVKKVAEAQVAPGVIHVLYKL